MSIAILSRPHSRCNPARISTAPLTPPHAGRTDNDAARSPSTPHQLLTVPAGRLRPHGPGPHAPQCLTFEWRRTIRVPPPRTRRGSKTERNRDRKTQLQKVAGPIRSRRFPSRAAAAFHSLGRETQEPGSGPQAPRCEPRTGRQKRIAEGEPRASPIRVSGKCG